MAVKGYKNFLQILFSPHLVLWSYKAAKNPSVSVFMCVFVSACVEDKQMEKVVYMEEIKCMCEKVGKRKLWMSEKRILVPWIILPKDTRTIL